jgi:hypothetical protein
MYAELTPSEPGDRYAFQATANYRPDVYRHPVNHDVARGGGAAMTQKQNLAPGFDLICSL